MLTFLIIGLFQILLTVGFIMVWKSVMNNNQEQLPRVFFAITTVRIVFSVAIYAVVLWIIRTNVEMVKIFTLIYIVLYMLLLGFDTAYFYCSLQKINNKK